MKESQTDRLLKYMQEHDGITQEEAIRQLHCYRLSARIADLKKRNVAIIAEREQKKAATGETIWWCRYRLAEAEHDAETV